MEDIFDSNVKKKIELDNLKDYTNLLQSSGNTGTSFSIDVYTRKFFRFVVMSGDLTVNNPTDSRSFIPDGTLITYRISDDGTARAITWGSDYVSILGTALPTTTIVGAEIYISFRYSTKYSASGRWDCVNLSNGNIPTVSLLAGGVDDIATGTAGFIDVTTVSVPAGTLSSEGDSITFKFFAEQTGGPSKYLKLFAFGIEILPSQPLNQLDGNTVSGEAVIYRRSNNSINAIVTYTDQIYSPIIKVVSTSNQTLSSTTLSANSHDIIIKGSSSGGGNLTVLGYSMTVNKANPI